jgi:hypothetical protein
MKKILIAIFSLIISAGFFAPMIASASCSPVALGGTGNCYFVANTLLLGNGTSPIATTTAGTNGQFLSLVVGVPTWATVPSGSGTISTSSPLSAGLLVQSTAWNTIANIATSSLNLGVSSFVSPDISQWTNDAGYITSNNSTFGGSSASSTLLGDNNTFSGIDSFSNASSNFGGTWHTFAPSHFFDFASWYATTSAPQLTTLANLSLPYSQVTGISGTYPILYSGGAISTAISTSTLFSLSAWYATTSASQLNAGSATKLATARAINGVNFDGTAAITITAASSTLLGDSNTFSSTNLFSGNLNLFDQNFATTKALTLEYGAASSPSASSILAFDTGAANRTITLSGSPTLGDWFDQSVKTTASPTFVNVSSSNATSTLFTSTTAWIGTLNLTNALSIANGGTGSVNLGTGVVQAASGALSAANPTRSFIIGVASTTALTGTTTSPQFSIPFGMTVTSWSCTVAPTGATAEVAWQYANPTAYTTVAPTYLAASTTPGSVSIGSNNTPTAQATSTLSVGNPAGGALSGYCTFIGNSATI